MPHVTDDNSELQERLASASQYAKPLRGGKNGDPPQTVKESGDSLLDNIQWEVLPNGVYVAAGRTQPHLPPGAYTLKITDSGKPLFETKHILTDALIDLGDSNARDIINEIRLFWTRKDRYREHNLLYKRGVLMWGDAGSGKTATLSMLVEDLIKMGGIVLIVTSPRAATIALPVLRRIEPERPLINVLEDCEEIIAMHGEHDLLALLDGEHQTDNVVNLATTNYPEMLGPRIVNRPSRFDLVKRIRMPSDQMRHTYLNHVLGPKVTKYDIPQWVADTRGLSVAHLKEIVVAVTCLDQDYHEVIKRIRGMATLPKSQMYEAAVGFSKSQPEAGTASGR